MNDDLPVIEVKIKTPDERSADGPEADQYLML